MRNDGARFPIVNALIDRDGLVHVLSTKSVWGSGDGGPWPGVADKDAAHLVCWQIEVEDLGRGQTFTPAQLASLGEVLAALVSLGVPRGNIINHRDWTDGTGGVGGFPLPTRGRKVDTRYDTDFLRALADKAALPKPTPPKPRIVVTWDKLKAGDKQALDLVASALMRLDGDRFSPSKPFTFSNVRRALNRYRLATFSVTYRGALQRLAKRYGLWYTP